MSSVVDAAFKMHQMRLNREADTEGWISKKKADWQGHKIQGLRERLKDYAGKVYERYWRKDGQLAQNGTLQVNEDKRQLRNMLLNDIQPFIEKNWESNRLPTNIYAIAHAHTDDFLKAAESQIPENTKFTRDELRKGFATFAMSAKFQEMLDKFEKERIAKEQTGVAFNADGFLISELIPYAQSGDSQLFGYRFGPNDSLTHAIFVGMKDEVVQKAKILYEDADREINNMKNNIAVLGIDKQREYFDKVTKNEKVWNDKLPGFKYTDPAGTFERKLQSKIVAIDLGNGAKRAYAMVEMRDTRFNPYKFFPLDPIYVQPQKFVPIDVFPAVPPAQPPPPVQQPPPAQPPPQGGAGPSGVAGGGDQEGADGNQNNGNGDVDMAPAVVTYFNPIGSRTRGATRVEERLGRRQ